MKISDIYSSYKDDLRAKDPSYKKIACLNYVLLAIYIVLNFVINLLIKIDVPVLSLFLLIYYAINIYFINVVFCVISLVNSILQGKVNFSIYTILSIISTIIMIILTIVSIVSL